MQKEWNCPSYKLMMIACTFKLAFLAASVVVGVALVSAFRRAYRTHGLPWLAHNAEAIANAADLAGIETTPLKCRVLAPLAPLALFVFRIAHRKKTVRIDAQLTDALTLLGNALKSGLSLAQAIEMASIEMPKPLGPELGRVVAQLKLGLTVEEALELFAKRLPSDDVGLVVQSVEILRRTGGNLIETFSTLAATIEGRRRVEDRIRVLTANGMYQGIMLLIMPWGLGAMLYVIAPEYISPLFQTTLGLIFIGFGMLLETIGGLWLKKIVMIRV